MNQEQVKSALRWLVATFGGGLAGFFAAKGWFTVDQVLNVLNSETFVGIVVSLVGLVWGLFVHTEKNAVIVADASPGVAGVVMKPTEEGKALADAIPSKTVATAGTPEAVAIAKK